MVKMAPGITERIKKLSEGFGWSEGELAKTLLQEISDIKLPFTIFTPEEKVKIVLAEINQDTAQLENIYVTSQKRFKKKFRIK